jgi:serine/threonine protein phosphatase PrpC
VDRGELDEEDADSHPKGNILLGGLGMRTTPPPVDVHLIPRLQPGDVLMACSDGLWHYFKPEEIGPLLAEQPPRVAVELLIAEARRRARGGGDNLSIAVLKLEDLPPPSE